MTITMRKASVRYSCILKGLQKWAEINNFQGHPRHFPSLSAIPFFGIQLDKIGKLPLIDVDFNFTSCKSVF
jgi:hypothetical protein